MSGNRTQKYTRRHRLLQRFRNDLRRPDPPRPEVGIDEADETDATLSWVRSHTTPREWHLLNRAAAESLEAIAESEGMRLGTLKSLLSRCRARLRHAS